MGRAYNKNTVYQHSVLTRFATNVDVGMDILARQEPDTKNSTF